MKGIFQILHYQILAERTKILGLKPYIKYVMPFKNKGSMIGISLTHPHSQIYALPFIPPKVMKEIKEVEKFRKESGTNLFDEILRLELEE